MPAIAYHEKGCSMQVRRMQVGSRSRKGKAATQGAKTTIAESQ
jgi:hypothetical protein